MMWTTLNRANMLKRKGHSRLELMSQSRIGHSTVGILVGLISAGVTYQIVPLIGVAISSAETVDDLPGAWFLVRIWPALIVAKLSGGWTCHLLLRRHPSKGAGP